MKSIIKKISQGLLLVPALVFGLGFFAAPAAHAVTCPVSGGIEGGIDCATPADSKKELVGEGGIFQTIVNILLFIVGAISVIMLIVGGIRYVVSGGDQSAVTGAKNTILYAIVGIVVAFLAYAAVNFVVTQLAAGTA